MDNRFCIPRNWSKSGGIAQNYKSPAAAAGAAAAARANQPKVVQIPVRFVGSNSKPKRSEPDSAVMIQKVFRGFLIRSRVKKILELKVEADKIEDRMSRNVELIRNDNRERLRINEMLMSLLFKLDSICGVVDPGVRVCRKSVIKKVIALQERLDSIAENVGESEIIVDSAQVKVEVVDSVDESNENVLDNDSESKIVPDAEIRSGVFDLGIEKAAQSETKSYDVENDDVPFEDAIDSGMQAKSEEETNVVGESGGNPNAMITDTTSIVSECMEETQSAVNNGDVTEKTAKMEEEEEENGGEKKREDDEEMNHQQVLKRLMEDNQTMMNMMTQLFERNEMQTQMLNTLRSKVDLLEKAFVSDRMRKKKKRHCPS